MSEPEYQKRDIDTPGSEQVLKTVMKEELDETFIRVVLSPEAGTGYSYGVGTPFLCQHPITGVIYFLFTGWTQSDGSDRGVFVGEINENFNISNIRELIGATAIGGYNSHIAVHAVYDEVNNNWLIFTSSYPSGDATFYHVLFFRYSSDFATLIASQTPAQLSGADWNYVRDSGACPVRLVSNVAAKKWLLITYVDRDSAGASHSNLRGAITTDYTVNTPTFTDSPDPIAVGWRVPVNYESDMGRPDIHHTTYGLDHLLTIAEMQNPIDGAWRLVPIFIHYYWNNSLTNCRWIGGIASQPLLPPLLGGNPLIGCGMPHLTPLPDDKTFNLFFAQFISENLMFHKICVVKLPISRLDPQNYPSIIYRPWGVEKTIDADDSCIPMPWWGRKTIYFHSDVAGNLDLELDPSGHGEWEAIRIGTGITDLSPPYQTEISSARARLTFSAAATVRSIVVMEPR